MLVTGGGEHMLGRQVVPFDPGLHSRQPRTGKRPLGDEAHCAWRVTLASLRRDNPVANSRNTVLRPQSQHNETDRGARNRGRDREAQPFAVVEAGPLPLDECAPSVGAVGGRDCRRFGDSRVSTRLRNTGDVVKRPLTKARRSIAQLGRWIVEARHGVIVCGTFLPGDRHSEPPRPASENGICLLGSRCLLTGAVRLMVTSGFDTPRSGGRLELLQ